VTGTGRRTQARHPAEVHRREGCLTFSQMGRWRRGYRPRPVLQLRATAPDERLSAGSTVGHGEIRGLTTLSPQGFGQFPITPFFTPVGKAQHHEACYHLFRMQTSSPIVIGLLLSILPLLAQENTASLTGTVQDPLGARLAQAHAELRSERPAGNLLQAEADNSGVYTFSALAPGTYVLRLTGSGFTRLSVKSIDISGGEQKVMPPVTLNVSVMGDCGSHAALDSLRLLPGENRGGNLRGTVLLNKRQKSGQRLANVAITVICASGSICGTTTTDSVGEFAFVDLAAETFTVRASRAGLYPINEPGYKVQTGFEATYYPMYAERCSSGGCDPKRRPKKPIACE
jgi:hypothetical protein